MGNKFDIENLKYKEKLLDHIKNNISLLGVVDSYFKINGKEHSRIKKESSVKVYPENKFFYDCCCFHFNTPNLHSFFVDEKKQLFYCFGCGASGSVFDFIYDIYDLNINQITELLGAIINIFDYDILDDETKKIYSDLILNYGKQDYLIEESKRKTEYLNKRIEAYLSKIDLDNINFVKVANRLCCSYELVEKKYKETDYYKKIERKKNKLLSKERRLNMFN